MKKRVIISSVVSVFAICIVSLFALNGKQETKYKRHFTFTGTTRVGGFIPNVQSDSIVDVPEEYVLSLYGFDITYEELVSELGEPSGTVGSGIVRDYWRIGKDRYAVCSNSIGTPFLHFEIWTGTETEYDLAHQKNAQNAREALAGKQVLFHARMEGQSLTNIPETAAFVPI